MKHKIRWGIISTGAIARQFAQGLSFCPDAELVAVGSRTQATADRFGAMFHVPHRHPSYEALAADPDVEVVYIGTPHNLHRENTLLCLGEGKAVLCEKPFAINAAQAETMIAAARSKGLFLMEALWTRYLPAIVELRKLLAAGVIGDILMIEANFGFRPEYNPLGRLFNPELGGGALLDIGIYPISLAYFLLGPPSRLTGMADLGRTGVDERSAVIFGYPSGQLAVLHFSLVTEMPSDVLIMGTEGRIKVHSPIYRPEKLTVMLKKRPGLKTSRLPEFVKRLGKSPALAVLRQQLLGHKERPISLPAQGNGYNYEAAEVMRCLREGKGESPSMPLDETLAIMRTMDQIRAQWGLVYPGEGRN
jgi:predicted dehydrogenase